MESYGKKISVTVSNDIVTDQRMARICNSLAEMGYEVEIIGRQLKNSLSLKGEAYEQKRLCVWLKKGPLFYIELNIRLFLYLCLNKPSMVYSVDADTAIAGLLAKKILGLKLIYDAHELFSEVPELIGRKTKQDIWRCIEKQIIMKSDLRITVTDSIANHYLERYGAKFSVIKNFSVPKLKNQGHEGEKFILYQGALNKGRGLEALILASEELPIKIKIAGQGDCEKDLKELAAGNINVEFIGKLIPSELEKLTAQAWLGYNLLEDLGLSYRFSLSNKTFDYIQAGIPQLLPNLIEYININSTWNFGLITNLNAKSIIEAVNMLRSNIELYASLRQNANKAAEVLVWEKEGSKLKELIFELGSME